MTFSSQKIQWVLSSGTYHVRKLHNNWSFTFIDEIQLQSCHLGVPLFVHSVHGLDHLLLSHLHEVYSKAPLQDVWEHSQGAMSSLIFRHARVSSTYPSKSVGPLVGDTFGFPISGRPTWQVEERGPQLFLSIFRKCIFRKCIFQTCIFQSVFLYE